MRWKEEREGDRRVKTFFALFPAWIRSTDTNVWLEWVTVEQVNHGGYAGWINEREVKP